MLQQTRRRALGLLIASLASVRIFGTIPQALAAAGSEDTSVDGSEDAEKPDCFDSKKIGVWTGQASDLSAGATQNEVPAIDPQACDLYLKFQVNAAFDSRVYVEGSPEGTRLPETVLRDPKSRFIAKSPDGTIAVDTPFCGNCTDIYEDTVSLVLPLATAPLLRDEPAMEIVLRLAGKADDCRFRIDCVALRKALDWAVARRDELAVDAENDRCASLEGCFITTACCEAVGLADDCFELRILRRYRDEFLAKQPNGPAEIARYYALAPAIVRALSKRPNGGKDVLLALYGCYVLPASLCARLGLNGAAYRLYAGMLNSLSRRTLGVSAKAGVRR